MKMTTTCLAIWSIYVSPAMAVVYINNGLVHNLTSQYHLGSPLWVDYLSPEVQTTINILPGGSGSRIFSYSTAIINCPGGTFDQIRAYDHSTVSVSGAHSPAGVWGYNDSQITVSDVGLMLIAEVHDNSHMTISGGQTSIVSAYDTSQITINGFWLPYIPSFDMTASDSSRILIDGYGFLIDGIPVDNGETITSIFGGDYGNEPLRHITGILASGDTLSCDIRIGNSASLAFIPEPSTTILLLSGLFLVLRRRR